jgi:hypothetical protein
MTRAIRVDEHFDPFRRWSLFMTLEILPAALVDPRLGFPLNPLLRLALGLEAAKLDGWKPRDYHLHIPAVIRLHLCRPEIYFRIVGGHFIDMAFLAR